VTSFRFTIALPPDAGYSGLFREVADQMSRYIGFADEQASQAGDLLARLVAERLERASETGETVTVTFERPAAGTPVTVEVSGPGLAMDAALAGGLVVEQGGGHTRLRLAFQPRD
jgi:hypothetical protein